NIYIDGKLDRQETDIDNLWRDDMVAFVLGCSFTFELALLAEGIRLAHIDENKVVSMYCTSIETRPAGPFRGPMVVSMRPMSSSDARNKKNRADAGKRFAFALHRFCPQGN
ncbi:DUF1445 domain-containing protein, partial [bacterium]|nr:DUF1445 domain-containing protein [bacterium]